MATTINSNTTDGIVITPDTSGEIELQANGVTKAKVTANGLQDANGASLRGGMYRNLIINGDMQIAQRGTSFANANNYSVDRFLYAKNNSGAVTITQDTDVPTGQGFTKSLKISCTTAQASIGSSEYGLFQQRIEGQMLQHLKYGTDNAEKLTLSFWVKSNKIGIYCFAIQKLDTTRYDYVTEYSISSANTWEKKTITISPDSNIQASGGVIDNDNGIGFALSFALADGASRQGTNNTWNTTIPVSSTSNQVNFLDSTSNYINLTGLQLEVGEGASDFEFLPYDVQLARCQRYYQANSDATGIVRMFPAHLSVGNRDGVVSFVTSMRTAPTVTSVNSTGGGGAYWITTDGFNVYSGNVSSSTLVQLQSFTASAEL